jgi:hypothetical protein
MPRRLKPMAERASPAIGPEEPPPTSIAQPPESDKGPKLVQRCFSEFATIQPLNMGENMGRQLQKLSALAVAKATARGYYGDGGGLWLQVARGGSKSWVFRWARAGKQREMGLGGAHTVSLADARAKARVCRQLLLDGLDPIEVREAADRAKGLERARAMTFDQCGEAYIAAHRHGWRNEKHAVQWTSC